MTLEIIFSEKKTFVFTCIIDKTNLRKLMLLLHFTKSLNVTREGFLRKNIVAVSFFQNYTPVFLIHVHIFFVK